MRRFRVIAFQVASYGRTPWGCHGGCPKRKIATIEQMAGQMPGQVRNWLLPVRRHLRIKKLRRAFRQRSSGIARLETHEEAWACKRRFTIRLVRFFAADQREGPQLGVRAASMLYDKSRFRHSKCLFSQFPRELMQLAFSIGFAGMAHSEC
jgi:hypothetical protein